MKNEVTTFVFRTENLDEYQRGFISGIMYLLSGRHSTTSRWCKSLGKDDGFIWIKDLDCTVEQGKEIYDEIEKHFPGVILDMVNYTIW